MTDRPAQFTVQDKNGVYQFPGELGRALTALVADPDINARLYGNGGSLLATYTRADGLQVNGGLPVILQYQGKGEEFAIVVGPNGTANGAPLGPGSLTEYLKFGWVLS